MSDPSEAEKTYAALGRGRGRGLGVIDPEARAATSLSTSEKRKSPEDGATGNGRPNGNGNGQKRGTTRDSRQLANYRTKPEHVLDKQGTSGTTRMFSANYFKLLRKPNFKFSLYRVDFEPETDNVLMRKAFVGAQREFIGGYLYDGKNMIYTTQSLPNEVNEFTVTSREGTVYKITVKNTGKTIEMNDAEASQIFNLILRRTMDGLKMELVGRNLYDPKSKVALSEYKIELWPGYITSIRQHEEDILVCCEVSHKVMRKDTLYEILRNCKNESRNDWKDDFKREVVGSIVLTDYNLGGNSKTYRIDDVDFSQTPRSTFNMKGTDISYADYYKQRYNLTVNDVGQPLLVSNPKARDERAGRNLVIILVPEFCRATGLTDKMRANFRMMKDMAVHTQMDPMNRRTRLLELTKRWNQTPECMQTLNSFNCDVEKQLVNFSGRALPQELMLFGKGQTSQNNDGVDWTNAAKSNEMYFCVSLKKWALMYPKRCERETEEFLVMLNKVASGLRYDMSDPKKIVLNDDRIPTYINELQKIVSKDPSLIMIIVPNNAADRYAAIKKLTCVTNAVPTQVVVSKTLMPKKGNTMSIATKVMIQINSKLGGAPWMVKFPLKGVMTIGFDVTHDTSDRTKSYGAFVASMDLKRDVKYYSAVSAHQSGDEMSSNIDLHVVEALKTYKNLYGELPERIFFYRDGVGEGDIQRVHSSEV